ncbi:hypothetical protein HG535_0D01600 [Zygotorulaspora mrakii]|uniref:Uncharacterized protein n=1 Tax=Zygotorulaspora mrakii TaxID=42260 RepID=A0A7H9B3Z4_ZYGMR|nr:uncharacterized protein HG535_0D01600 [Zygotorulaspora mrakii]QLG72452.1 hypothetical protein HG535_0D01600 [Zygotorulaspora mrakii]
MALTSVHDVLEVEKRISAINEKREQLALRLKRAQEVSVGGNGGGNHNVGDGIMDTMGTDVDSEEYLRSIAKDITSNATSLEGIRRLRTKYGALRVLDVLERAFKQRETKDLALVELGSLREEMDGFEEETSLQELDRVGKRVASVRERLGDDSDEGLAAYNQLNGAVSLRAKVLCGQFKDRLLESKWDTSATISSDTMGDLRRRSTDLYKLSLLIIGNLNHNQSSFFWNFQCIANNFEIKFTYHFHDDSLKMETFFKYMNDYLNKNLYRCISIFHDEVHGITRQLIHEQFIDHVLQPIREKVVSGLSHADSKVLISLISEILNTDKNLETFFHYHGRGMISLVPAEIWDMWLAYEVETATNQFDKLISNPKEMVESSSDFIKLLNKVYSYLKPFYGLEFEPLKKYKLLSCSQIFIKLSSLYLDRLLTINSLGDTHTGEDELNQTLMKLQNINIVYERIIELSEEYIFIHLTDVVNEWESKNYTTLFQNVLEDYRKIMEESVQPTVVHRVKKLLKESLRNYFKLGVWSTVANPDSDTATSELVDAIKLITRIMMKLDSLSIPLAVSTCIKNELLNIIVNYFIESILKLNKFSKQGLDQFELDFRTIRDALNLSNDNTNAQEGVLFELVKVLSLKYDPDGQKFFGTAYIKELNYRDLKNHLRIKTLTDFEIQDALYRIAYGNIL